MPSLHARIPLRQRVRTEPLAAQLSTRLRTRGSHVTVVVSGEVDLVTVPVLQDAFEGARRALDATRGHATLLVDLRDVSFLGASGLAVLAFAHLLFVDDGMTMHVIGDHSAVRRPIELTGLARLLASPSQNVDTCASH